MLSISVTENWRTAHPGGMLGLLELSAVSNPSSCLPLEERKRETEIRLRDRYDGFTRSDFLSLPVMAAYDRYYKRFNKTYHVQLQLESIVLHGKNLPKVSPLVDVNFAAELETLILTAGHDVARLCGEVVFDVSREGDQIEQMNRTVKDIRPGDMIMRDDHGICCTIIYGQDNRSMITPETTGVLYVAYAPAGVPEELIRLQLAKIEEAIWTFSPRMVRENIQLIQA